MSNKRPVIKEESTVDIDAASELRDDLDDTVNRKESLKEESIYAKEIEKNLEEMLQKDKNNNLEFNMKVFSQINLQNEAFFHHRHPLIYQFEQRPKLTDEQLDEMYDHVM